MLQISVPMKNLQFMVNEVLVIFVGQGSFFFLFFNTFFIECYYIQLHLLLHTLPYSQFHTFTLLTHKYHIYTLIYIYLH